MEGRNNLSLSTGIIIPTLKEYSNLSDNNVINLLRIELWGPSGSSRKDKTLLLIYCIHRNDTLDLYVGSTIEPEVRFYNHLISGRDSNKHLQRSFEKYGKQNFTLYNLAWVELSSAKTEKGLPREEIMISYEQKYIDLLKPTYNFSQLAGINRLGIKHSEESKELRSERMKGKNLGKIPINTRKLPAPRVVSGQGIKLKDEEKQQLASRSKHRKKPVYFYDDYNNLVSIYDSLNATYRGENCNKTNLLNCIKTGKLFRGWLVCYKPIR